MSGRRYRPYPLTPREHYGDKPLVQSMGRIPESTVKWLWRDWFPANKVSMIVGPDGVGKSLVALSIAAHVTNGQAWPDKATNYIEPESGVLYLTEADAPEDTLRQRLSKMRAIMDRVFILQQIEKAGPIEGERTPFSIEGTIEMLTEIIESIDDCRLLVIDPLSNYLNTKAHEQKLMIASLVELAQRLQVGVLLVNRTPHFGEEARAVWTIVRDRRDRACRYLVPVSRAGEKQSGARRSRHEISNFGQELL